MTVTSPRSTGRQFDTAPLEWGNVTEWLRMVSSIVNDIMDGKINATGDLTLAASSATTTLTDRRIGPGSYIGLMPTTANASAEQGAGTIYVSSRGKQTATVTHANNAQTDRTYRYVVLG